MCFQTVFSHDLMGYLIVAKSDMGKPPFEASEGGYIENGWVMEDFTLSEFLFCRGMTVPIRLKVRLEASPNGSPMSVS